MVVCTAIMKKFYEEQNDFLNEFRDNWECFYKTKQNVALKKPLNIMKLKIKRKNSVEFSQNSTNHT